MFKAITLFETSETNKRVDELNLIKVRYLSTLASIYYIKGLFIEAKKQVEKALELCADESKYTYDTQADFVKHLKELKSM